MSYGGSRGGKDCIYVTSESLEHSTNGMGRQLFIADVHLRGGGCERSRRLLDWMATQAGRCESLIILGDLFDFWIGPKHVALPDHREVLDELGRWSRAGVRVELFAGNRDFYLGSVLTDRYGIRVHSDFDVRVIGGRRTYLSHGDLFCGADKKYRRTRLVIRSRLAETILTSLPTGLACAMAGGFRNHSRRVVAGKSDRELALCEQTIRRVFNGKGDLNYGRQNVSTGEVDVIICGHTHHCARYEYQLDDREGLVYSLGSWIEGGSFLEVIGEQFVLHSTLDA